MKCCEYFSDAPNSSDNMKAAPIIAEVPQVKLFCMYVSTRICLLRHVSLIHQSLMFAMLISECIKDKVLPFVPQILEHQIQLWLLISLHLASQGTSEERENKQCSTVLSVITYLKQAVNREAVTVLRAKTWVVFISHAVTFFSFVYTFFVMFAFLVLLII